MFKNYMKIAIRNLKRHKGFSFINITGLALGIACFLFILVYVQDELSYDGFHEDADSIYQILTHTDIKNNSITPTPLAPKLKEECPEIIDAARYHWIWGGAVINYNDKTFEEDGLRLVDPSFFKVFDFPFIMGDPNRALNDPYSIVITKASADKYFGDEYPIGKVVTLNHQHQLIVTGVIENVPSNSTLQFDMLVSLEFNILNIDNPGSYLAWENLTVYTFIKCRDHCNVDELNKKINRLVRNQSNRKSSFSLLPFMDRYFFFYSNKTSIYAFITIAVFVLLVACFNFMNLSTARSARRAKEIGMRKIVGAYRKQIILQFLGESTLLSLIAGICALILFSLLLPLFSTITGKEVILQYPFLLLSSLGVALFSGIVAGSYPALFLSRFKVIPALKGNLKSSFKGKGLRKTMVVAQFIISILLIIGMLVVNQQKYYMQSKDIGYDKRNIVSIPLDGGSIKYYQVFKNELLKDSRIVCVTGTASSLPFFNWHQGNIQWEGKNINDDISVSFNKVDYDFIKTLNIDLVEGRDFTRALSSDAEYNFLVNEEMAKKIGIHPVAGATLKIGDHPGKIVGVIENFHFSPLQRQIEPLILRLSPEDADNMLIRIQPENLAATLSFIENTWKNVVPQYPFQYSFLNEDYERSLFNISRIGYLLTAFSVLTIMISCLGLFGLSSYAVEQRTKEIGIRKVLGASVSNIVTDISKEFIILVLIANIIAWPLAYYLMNRWLQNFAYRINIGWWILLSAGVLALAIALFTVSYQSIKAALANPVESLHYD